MNWTGDSLITHKHYRLMIDSKPYMRIIYFMEHRKWQQLEEIFCWFALKCAAIFVQDRHRHPHA